MAALEAARKLIVGVIIVYLMILSLVPETKRRRIGLKHAVVEHHHHENKTAVAHVASGPAAAREAPRVGENRSLASLHKTVNVSAALQRAPLYLVYVYFANSIPPDHYQWASIRIALYHGNSVLLVTYKAVAVPRDLSGQVTILFAEELETELLRLFRQKYAVTQGTTQKEPWERQNMERFFVLHEMMERRRMSHVFYADSDVAVTSLLSLDAMKHAMKHAECDSMLSFKNDNNTFADAVWVGWAGTAILTRALLKDFISYSVKLLEPEPFVLLKWKFQLKPYVCDMSIWYLFMVAHGVYSGVPLSEYWSVPPARHKLLPPSASKWRFCDSVEMGFDHMRGHRKPGFVFDRKTRRAFLNKKPLLSIHFQGDSKRDIFEYVSVS